MNFYISTLTMRTDSRTYEQRPFPSFRKPRVIGSFSVDKNRTFTSDRSQLKFLKRNIKLKRDLDLNEGMENVERKNEDSCKEEKLNLLLTWILNNKNVFKLPNEHQLEVNDLRTDFVCFRGCLSTLMASPYLDR